MIEENIDHIDIEVVNIFYDISLLAIDIYPLLCYYPLGSEMLSLPQNVTRK